MSADPGENGVERAWNEAAVGYDSHFGPRFAPYSGAALGALLTRRQQLPDGAILSPCVGPGRDLATLSRGFPDRVILASDLSDEMVRLARARSAHCPNVSVERADAMNLSASKGAVAALISVFGLKLLPDPGVAFSAWLSLLHSGGLLAVVYWPRDAEPKGPFFSMRRLLRHAGVMDGSWEGELFSRAEAARGRVIADVPLAFEIQYEDAKSAWSALTRFGGLRALAVARGQAFIDALGLQFVADLPAGAITHTPEARLLLVERH